MKYLFVLSALVSMNAFAADQQKLKVIISDDRIPYTYMTADQSPDWEIPYNGSEIISHQAESSRVKAAIESDDELVATIGFTTNLINTKEYQMAFLNLQNSQEKCVSVDPGRYGDALSIWLVGSGSSDKNPLSTYVWIQNLALPNMFNPASGISTDSNKTWGFDPAGRQDFNAHSNPKVLLKWIGALAKKNEAYCESLVLVKSEISDSSPAPSN